MIKAIIFDIDGTLVDTVGLHARAWQEAFQHYGHDFPIEQIRPQIGKGGDQLLPVFLSREEIERRGKEIEKYRDDLFKRKYFPMARPFPMVRELFQHIRAGGQKIALAWLINPEAGFYWHNGGTGGYASLVMFDPKRDRAIVVLYNCLDMDPARPQLTDRVAANMNALMDGKPVPPLAP